MPVKAFLPGFFAILFLSACQKNKAQEIANQSATSSEEVIQKSNGIHSYGGWYCPDNLTGFPPVNIADLSKVPIVEGRMPTKEETRNGTSLMYFDPEEIPDARPLEIDLPQLATYYSVETEQYETVIVIQAVVAGLDTVVGFRFPSGGNGSAWHRIMTFHGTDKPVDDAPFVSIDKVLPYSQNEIWAALMKTSYAHQLADLFGEEYYFDEGWKKNISTSLEVSGSKKAKGIVSTMWGSIYMQIDYQSNGMQAVEKVFVMENENGDSSKVLIVAGPYPQNYGQETLNWSSTFKELQNGLSPE